MTPKTLIYGIICGCILLCLGLIPGLFRDLTEGVRNFHNSFSSPYLRQRRPYWPASEVEQPVWLAGAGAALIVLSIVGFVLS